MKNVLPFILFLLCNMFSIAQQMDSHVLKSVVYEVNEQEKAEKQSLTYTLENGGLRIQGYMYTNSCGIHVMNCLIVGNQIYLSRTDIGELCDSEANYKVDIFIDGVHEQNYTVSLSEYGCENDAYDYAEITAISISYVKEGYSLQYAEDHCILTLHEDEQSFIDGKVRVYNLSGEEIWVQEIKDSAILIPIKELALNCAICKITNNEKSYSIKLVKL